MESLHWAINNWFIVLNAIGVVGGLLFTAISLRSEARTRRVANLIAITGNHREIWSQIYKRPELARVLDEAPDLRQHPMTQAEELFVNMVILHLNSAFYAMKDHLLVHQEGLRRDVRWFLSRPIPKAVWEKIKPLQNAPFVEFVERCRQGKLGR